MPKKPLSFSFPFCSIQTFEVILCLALFYRSSLVERCFHFSLFLVYVACHVDSLTILLYQVSHHPPMSAGHAENEHFTYDVTSKLKTKFLGNSLDVYPVGR